MIEGGAPGQARHLGHHQPVITSRPHPRRLTMQRSILGHARVRLRRGGRRGGARLAAAACSDDNNGGRRHRAADVQPGPAAGQSAGERGAARQAEPPDARLDRARPGCRAGRRRRSSTSSTDRAAWPDDPAYIQRDRAARCIPDVLVVRHEQGSVDGRSAGSPADAARRRLGRPQAAGRRRRPRADWRVFGMRSGRRGARDAGSSRPTTSPTTRPTSPPRSRTSRPPN